MTQFDVSTPQIAPSGPNGQWTPADMERIAQQEAGNGEPQTPAQQAMADGENTPEGNDHGDGDTLALLTSKAQTLINTVAPLHTVYGIGGEFAIKCATEIGERQLRRWQHAAMPPHKRKNGGQGVGMLDIDQRRIGLRLFHETGRELHMKLADGSWRKIPVAESGSIFETQAVKNAFGVIDGDSLINRLFGGKDGLLVRASNEVLAAAGWQDGVDTDTSASEFDDYAELDPPKGP